jgi:hypothetical protein
MLGNNKYDNTVSIILAHPSTELRREHLKECIKYLETPIILSSNFTVDEETQRMCDWVIYDKENPLLLEHEYPSHNVLYHKWYISEQLEKIIEPFPFEHSYSVYCLAKNGLNFAKILNKEKVHVIHYDYIVRNHTIEKNNYLLDSSDFIFYPQFHNRSYSAGFFSGKVDALLDYFNFHKDKKSFYIDQRCDDRFLEEKLYCFYKEKNYNIKEENYSDLNENGNVAERMYVFNGNIERQQP